MKESYNVTENESVTMECELNRGDKKCVWKRYGKIIQDEERCTVEVDGLLQRLIIKDLTMFDKSNITCICIENSGKEITTTSTKLIIQGKL